MDPYDRLAYALEDALDALHEIRGGDRAGRGRPLSNAERQARARARRRNASNAESNAESNADALRVSNESNAKSNANQVSLSGPMGHEREIPVTKSNAETVTRSNARNANGRNAEPLRVEPTREQIPNHPSAWDTGPPLTAEQRAANQARVAELRALHFGRETDQ